FPGAVFPSVIAELAFLRDGVKDPGGLAGADVEGLHVAARGFLELWAVRDRRTDNNHVAADHRRRRQRVIAALGGPANPLGQVNPPFLAEIRIERSRLGVNAVEIRVMSGAVDALFAVASPVRETAMDVAQVGWATGFVDLRIEVPDMLACDAIDLRNLRE